MQFGTVVVIVLQFVVLVISLMDFSEFRATKVLRERCNRTPALSVLVYKSPIFCGLECSKNINCRRMMICTQLDGVECSLYNEGENCATLVPTNCSCFMKTYSKVNDRAICPIGLYGDYCEHTIRDCAEGNGRGLAIFSTWVRSYIKPTTSASAFEVICEFRFGGYTMFMLRDTMCRVVSFNRNITEYVDGFGDANGDHWLGLTRIKAILDNHSQNLLSVVLSHDTYCENYYIEFSIGAALEGYKIHLGQYQTWPQFACGDSLKGNVNIEGSRFSAPGSDQTSFNCADQRQGGWWYADEPGCSESYLMGSQNAMYWPIFRGNISLHRVALRIQPYSSPA